MNTTNAADDFWKFLLNSGNSFGWTPAEKGSDSAEPVTAKDKERLLYGILVHTENKSKATELMKEFVAHTVGDNCEIEALLQSYLNSNSKPSDVRPLCLQILKQSSQGPQLWKRSYKALYDEAWAACAADPFFGSLTKLHEPDGLVGDGGDEREDNLLFRMKLTLLWFHLSALDNDDGCYEQFGNDIAGFEEQFVEYVAGDAPLLKEMFQTCVKNGSICDVHDMNGWLLLWSETRNGRPEQSKAA